MEKPGDGLRMTYMPKDMTDFTFWQINATDSRNNGLRPPGTSVLIPNSGVPTAGMFWDTNEVPKSVGGTTFNAQVSYSKEADCIAIYWKGLDTSGI